MARMPAKVCVVAAQPNWAAVWHMFLLVLLLVGLLSSVVHARAEGPAAVPNNLVAADEGLIGRASAGWYGSTSGAPQSHSLPSVLCIGGGCCGAVCHMPAGLAATPVLPAPARAIHYLAFGAPAARESGSPGMFRPPIA